MQRSLVKLWLRYWIKKYREPKRWGRRPSLWRVYYRSKTFHIWFRGQNLDTLKQYIEHNRETVKYFLRGIYDSDGNNYKCRRIFLVNSNLKLLKYTQYLLKKYFDIRATGPYIQKKAGSIMMRNGGKFRRKVDVYTLEISRGRDIHMFLSQVGFSIREKQLGLPRRRR